MMKKLKIFTNAQKEEQWLNEMLQKGWQFKSVNGINVYSFEKTSNKQQILRIDCQSFASNEKFKQYKALYEEFGWVHVDGSRSSLLQYWLNPSNKDDALFSDQSSQNHYLQRLSKIYGTCAAFFLLLTFDIFQNSSQFTNIKAAYFTPGLWNKNGFDFWSAFLFETPFALIRFGSPWLTLIFAVIFLNTYFKYKKEIDKVV